MTRLRGRALPSFLSLLLACGLSVLLACGAEAPPEPSPAVEEATARGPDILLVTIDTLRADRVGAYGDPLAHTPAIDALAAEGVLFRESHGVTPLTLPSHASILTGLYPSRHGLRDNAGFRLPDTVPTLAGALQASGYHTGAFVSAFVLDGAWGLDRGFDVYRDPFRPADLGKVGSFGEVELPGAEVVNAALAWWRGQPKGEPRFVWVHLYDPHAPWTPHPEWPGDPYRSEVAYADSLVARLVAAVGKQTLIVLTSDHGEGLWEGGERHHGVLLGRAATRVPLIIRPPGGLSGHSAAAARSLPAPELRRPAGVDEALDLQPVPDAPKAARVVERPVSGVDIAPTLAELAGVTLAGDGSSLRASLAPDATEAWSREPVYAETFFPVFHQGWSPLFMAQGETERVELGARREAVSWQSGAPAAGADLDAIITRWKGEAAPTPGPIEGDVAERLAALGYMTAPPAPSAQTGADPRDKISLLAEIDAATASADLPAGIRSLRALVAREPDLVDARISLSLLLAAAGDTAGALEVTEAVLSRAPDHPTALANAAFLSRARGEGEAALQYARRMVALNPKDARGYRLVAAVLVDREDAAGVLEATLAGLAAAPEDPNLQYLCGLALVQTGDPAAAVEHLEAARRYGTQATDVPLWLGRAYEGAGELDKAKRAFEEATRSMQGDLRPWAMGGVMLAKADRCEEALSFLINAARRGAARDPAVQEWTATCEARLQQQKLDRLKATNPARPGGQAPVPGSER